MSVEYSSDERLLRHFFIDSIPKVLKQPTGFLKHPFVDPGSIYSGNLWDWDSYWAVYALLNLVGKPSMQEVRAGDSFDFALRDRILRHARGNVLNFLDLQMEDGYIPMMVCKQPVVNEEPYLIGRHREGVVMNMHKPFLCQQIGVISNYQGDYGWTAPMLESLKRYFDCYERVYYNHGCGLYVWADDIMIGMDNDPTSFGRPRFSTANIFLNSFMVRELRAMVLILQQNGQSILAEEFALKADRLTAAIQEECWDRRDRFFYSVDVDIKTRPYDWFHKGLGVFWKTLPLKIRTWSGFLPLLAGFATEEQASALALIHAVDPETFASSYGVRTLALDEKMYNLLPTTNPSNWLGPIWCVSNYCVFRGLLRYGYREQARLICDQTVRLLAQDLRQSGTLHEYYVPETGTPVMNGGFINWNMLVINMLDELHGVQPMDAYLG